MAQSDPLAPPTSHWIGVGAATTSPGVDQSVSFAWIQASYLVTDMFSVQIGLPFSDAGQGFPFQSQNLGNIYAGVLVSSRRSNVFSEFGIRLPTTGANASSPLAFRALAPESGEAFLDNVSSLTGNVNYIATGQSGAFLKLRAGISAWLDDLGRVGSETVLNYSAEVGLNNNGFRADARIQGRAFLSAGNAGVAERTFHQVRTAVRKTFGDLTPTATLRIPLGEFNGGVDYVLGLGVELNFAP